MFSKTFLGLSDILHSIILNPCLLRVKLQRCRTMCSRTRAFGRIKDRSNTTRRRSTSADFLKCVAGLSAFTKSANGIRISRPLAPKLNTFWGCFHVWGCRKRFLVTTASLATRLVRRIYTRIALQTRLREPVRKTISWITRWSKRRLRASERTFRPTGPRDFVKSVYSRIRVSAYVLPRNWLHI